ncbi:MAG TPA: AAA family ATPase [Candidatus Accumulibacter phosphatis]|nr:AAA family ATPase [Accumulibacter sp.]HRF13684.1 AAA family ATPase [Candidatus Accumulibacter phosphatis]
MHTLRFNQALRQAAEASQDARLPTRWPVLLVRDVYGRLRFAIDAYRPHTPDDEEERAEAEPPSDEVYPLEAYALLKEATAQLQHYATADEVLFRDDFFNPATLFQNPDWHDTLVPACEDSDGNIHPELTVRLLDRQIIGQDWLHTMHERAPSAPPRVVFYGLKGGVGRSTALAMLSYSFARAGKKVLLLDFDLESPGLSGLLLPVDRVAGFGLVDWFIEDGVQHGDSVLDDLVADSPLAENTTGRIRVAAAMGQGELAYLAKLARVYAELPTPTGPERFAQRMQRLVQALEVRERPDIVLIDSRAGLHDLAAISIATLADLALLFATDNEQNWQGYRQLFAHWQQRPAVLRGVRERLWMVRAMFPETDQKEHFDSFLERSHDLFSENLYDEIDPAQAEPENAFAYALDSEAAPHFPLIVRWSARFMEFDPMASDARGGVGDADIDLAFGPFAKRVSSILFGD